MPTNEEQNRQAGRTDAQGQPWNANRAGSTPGQATIAPSGGGQQVQQEARFYVNNKPLTTFPQKKAVVLEILHAAGFNGENYKVHRLSSKTDTQGMEVQIGATIEASRAEPVYLRCEALPASLESPTADSTDEGESSERAVGMTDLQKPSSPEAGKAPGGTRPGGGQPGTNPGTNPGRRNP